MNKKPSKQAKVEVILPTVKLQLQDLSYLKSLAAVDDKVRGIVPYKALDRLRILGLIENKKLGPCPFKMRERSKLERDTIKQISKMAATLKWDWSALNKLPFYTLKSPLPDRTITVLTAAGRALLKDGTTRVVVQKSCG